MSKFMKILLFVSAFAIAGEPELVLHCVAAAASDLTNVNVGQFRVSDGGPASNGNLCDNAQFRRLAGNFACRKAISYVLAPADSADVAVVDSAVITRPHVLLCCRTKAEGCHVWPDTNGRYHVDRDAMGHSGFVPDPGVK